MTNWLARYATRVAVRRVVTILVLSLLAWAGVGRAHAEDAACRDPSKMTGSCDDIQTAANFATAASDRAAQNAGFGGGRCFRIEWDAAGSGVSVARAWRVPNETPGVPYACDAPVSARYAATRFFPTSNACPVGSTWDNEARECTTECGPDGWADPTNPGQCLNQQKCLARNADLGSRGGEPRTSLVTCRDVGGCEFAFSSEGHDTIQGNFGPNGEMTSAYRGVMEYTGNPGSACGVPPEIDPDWNDSEVQDPEGQKCQGEGGRSLCVQNDGDICIEAATGRFLCWKRKETGEKADQDHLQKRDAGDQPIPPTMQLPNGDSLESKGEPMNLTDIDKSGNVTKTTVTNYTTVNGTNPKGGINEGQNKDGSGKEGDKDGEGEVTGGKDCIAAPTVTGGDPLLGEQIRQQWYARCGAPGDPSGFDAGWIGSEGEGDADALRNSFIVEGDPIGMDGLDFAGFGWNASCPTIPAVNINGKTIQFDTSVFCNWLALGGQLVLIMAALLSLRILAGVLN